MTIWRRFSRWLLGMALVILVIGWLVVAGLSFYCALTLTCDSEVAGWWRLFLTIVGLPLVVYQLYILRATIQKGQWKPEIEIGLMASPVDFSELESAKTLPFRANLDLDYLFSLGVEQVTEVVQFNIDSIASPIVLIVRNRGKRVARFVKIRLELTSFPGESPPLVRAKGFDTLSDETTLIFRGDADWGVYPHDMESFHLLMVGKSAMSFDGQIGQLLMRPFLSDEQQRDLTILKLFKPGDYDFRCTIWAEGLDGPATQKLRLIITDSNASERLERLARTIETIEQLKSSSETGLMSGPGIEL